MVHLAVLWSIAILLPHPRPDIWNHWRLHIGFLKHAPPFFLMAIFTCERMVDIIDQTV